MNTPKIPSLPSLIAALLLCTVPAFAAETPAAKSEAPAAKAAPSAAQLADLKTPAPATPENAAAFLGGWTLALEGPNGAAALVITLKNEAGKVTGEMASEMMETQKFAEVIRSGTGLIMRYNFDYQGMAIDAEAKLTPAGEKMNATVAFAGGAFVMEGSATKQAK